MIPMPTPEQIQIVIDNFNTILQKYPEADIDMGETIVNRCGTPMCHAGWYALAYHKKGKAVDWRHGARHMANDVIGEPDINYLCSWAMNNPDIWGNNNGRFLFDLATAFGKGKRKTITLRYIRNHWVGVKKRLIKLEDTA